MMHAVLARSGVVTGLLLGTACMNPVVYPREAVVARPGSVRLSGGVNYGYAHGTVREQLEPASPADAPQRAPSTFDGNAASAVRAAGSPLGAVFSAVWAEYQAAVGVFRPCEIGALAGLLRAGLELRCSLLDERSGAPFALALATAAMHRTVFINTDGIALRGGVELSTRAKELSPILNIYLRYGPTMRMLGDEELDDGEGEGFPRVGVEVERDELVLSVPVGIALVRGEHVIIGVVPELTLKARQRGPLECSHCTVTPTDFEQHWAVFVTLGLTATFGD
jgi:hypothetical protein